MSVSLPEEERKKEKMDFNMMARMRRKGVSPASVRQMIGRRGVSYPVNPLQKGGGALVARKRMGPPLKVVRQRGRGKKLKTLGKFFGSDIGKQVLAASVQSVAENAENPYVKTFGTSMAGSMVEERGKKRQDKKKVKSVNSSSSSSDTGGVYFSDEDYLEAIRRKQRGGGLFSSLGKAISVVRKMPNPLRRRYLLGF